MMQQNEIEHRIKKNAKHLRASMRALQKTPGKEAVHQFRVGIKKFRSFLRLSSAAVDNTGELRLTKKLKKAYAAAGLIRNLQLQVQRIKDLYQEERKPAEYLSVLNKAIRRQNKKLQGLLKKEPLVKTKRKIIANLPARLSNKTINDFFRGRAARIHTLLRAAAIADDDLHSIRKNIKDLIYVCKELKAKAGMHLPVICHDKTELGKAAAMEEALGKFIDLSMAVKLTVPACLDKIKPNEKRRLQLKRRKWFREKKSIRKELLKKLGDKRVFNPRFLYV